MPIRSPCATALLLMTFALAITTTAWLAAVFDEVPVRYVSMLGDGREATVAADLACPAIASGTAKALGHRTLLPLVMLGLWSLGTVALAEHRWRRPPRRSSVVLVTGIASTGGGVALVYGAMTLDSIVNVVLAYLAPIVGGLLVLAAMLVRDPEDPDSPMAMFVLVHAAVVGLLVPAAVAWLTPTSEAFVCL